VGLRNKWLPRQPSRTLATGPGYLDHRKTRTYTCTGLRNGITVETLTRTSFSRQPRSVDHRWTSEILERLLPSTSIYPADLDHSPTEQGGGMAPNPTLHRSCFLLATPSPPRVDPMFVFVVCIERWNRGVMLSSGKTKQGAHGITRGHSSDAAKLTFENGDGLPAGKNDKCDTRLVVVRIVGVVVLTLHMSLSYHTSLSRRS